MTIVGGDSAGRTPSGRPRRVRRVYLAAFGLLLMAAASSAFADTATVTGTVRFDKIPADPQQGLLLNNPEPRPAVGILVEVVPATASGSAGAGKPVGTARTDGDGHYTITFSLSTATNVYVRVRAELENAVVLDYDTGAEYAGALSPFLLTPETPATKNLRLGDGNRLSGAFNILDIVRQANALLRSASPNLRIPRVLFLWSPKYRDGSAFDPNYGPQTGVIYINGDRSIDSDEFDDFAVAHEYGHFIAERFSRDDSPGGDHFEGDQLDARLAWSEGWAHAFAAAALNNPDAVDTLGTNGSKVSLFTIKQDTPPWTKPGYTSEQSVGSVLWHIFTASPEGGTSLGRGFKPIFATVTGSLKNAYHVHLIDFADNLLRDNASDTALGGELAKVLGEHGITYTPGKSPSVPNPWKQPIESGTPLTGSLDSRTPASHSNREGQASAAAFYLFTLKAEGNVSIQLQTTASSTSATADLDLYVWNTQEDLVASSATTGGVGSTEQIATSLPAGTYLIEVRSWYVDELFGRIFYNSGSYQLTATY